VNVVLQPGQVALHHCLLAHASGPNRTHHSRVGLAARCLTINACQTTGPSMSAMLVRGRDDFGSFPILSRAVRRIYVRKY